MRRLGFLCFLFFILCTSSFSKESGPREGKRKIETSQTIDKTGDDPQSLPYNLPVWVGVQSQSPIINVFTAKHAGEQSECSTHEDRTEWASLAWCRSWEWLDSERVIAIFTVVLGLATGALWRSTDRLVTGAEKTAERQLRAYVFPTKVVLTNATTSPKITIEYQNCGQTPAYNVAIWTTTASAIYPLLEEPHGPEIEPTASWGHIGPGIPIHLDTFPEPSVTPGEIAALAQGNGALYMYGVLSYVDAFKKSRSLKFCYFKGGPGVPYRDGPMAVDNKWNDADISE
jgi:hypothetical protein